MACIAANPRFFWFGILDCSNVMVEVNMNIDRMVMAFAGSMVLLSALLAWQVNEMWLLLTAFVGLNVLQSAFTGFCPLAKVLKKLGVKPGNAFK